MFAIQSYSMGVFYAKRNINVIITDKKDGEERGGSGRGEGENYKCVFLKTGVVNYYCNREIGTGEGNYAILNSCSFV